ncbi:MAG: MFS transporter, partial [Candidatus Neomarinimicrobiota bacterium]
MSELKVEKKNRSGWFWVPSLYYAEGIPYIVAMVVSVAMYKTLGVPNSRIAFWTSVLYLPWVIKPLWSPFIEAFSTKRNWIFVAQLILGFLFLGIAFTIQLPWFFTITLIILWFLAFSSATHDIAADGFYMLGLNKHQQAWFVGVRSTFYRFAMLTGQGLLLILVGIIETNTGLESIDINVFSATDNQALQVVDMNSLNLSGRDGELEIICVPDTLVIEAIPRKRSEVDSIVSYAENWNVEQGHVVKDIREVRKITFLGRIGNVFKRPIDSLGNFIQKQFGEKKVKKRDFVGNVGTLYFHLSNAPKEGKEVVVIFGRDSGDKSISLLHGNRLIFSEKNWNKPAIAVIQLDINLKTATQSIFQARAGNTPLAWSLIFVALGILFIIFFMYHRFILPYPVSDSPVIRDKSKSFFSEFFRTFVIFFKKDNIGIYIAFLLLYRLSESQLVKLAQPFLLDAQEVGGLALTTGQVGFVYGTVGIVALIVGGLLGGFLAAKHGLKKWMWWMAVAINLPNAVYIYLSYTQPDSLLIINICVALEQLGYGFGFTAYMLVMIYIAEGEFKTAHFAITTAFMALGMMIPGMWSGWLQELIG